MRTGLIVVVLLQQVTIHQAGSSRKMTRTVTVVLNRNLRMNWFKIYINVINMSGWIHR